MHPSACLPACVSAPRVRACVRAVRASVPVLSAPARPAPRSPINHGKCSDLLLDSAAVIREFMKVRPAGERVYACVRAGGLSSKKFMDNFLLPFPFSPHDDSFVQRGNNDIRFNVAALSLV